MHRMNQPTVPPTQPFPASHPARVKRGPHTLAVSLDLPAGVEPGDDAAAACPTVIVTHGHTGDRIGRCYKVVELARRLAAEGIACVRFDQAGCGESSGDFQEITLADGIADVGAVAAWAADQPWCDASRIGHVAMSMASLLVLSMEASHPSRGVALWAPVYDLRQVAMTRGLAEAGPTLSSQGWFPYKGLRVGAAFAATIDRVDLAAEVARGKSPLLVLHSPDDEVVDVKQGRALAARCEDVGRPYTFTAVVGAAHDFNDYPQRQQVIGETIAFMKRVLLDT